MSTDLFGKFTGTATAVTSWYSFSGNYLLSLSGTHSSGTTQIEIRIPGTSPTEWSPAIAFDSETTLTADGTKEVSFAKGFQYRIATTTASATTRVVHYGLAPTDIG